MCTRSDRRQSLDLLSRVNESMLTLTILFHTTPTHSHALLGTWEYYLRCHTRLNDLLGDMPQSVPIDFIVSFVYGEVKAVGPIDLDVYKTGAVEHECLDRVAIQHASHLRMLPPRSITLSGRSRLRKNVFYAHSERRMAQCECLMYLGVKNGSATLIDPEIALDEATVFQRQQTVREADEAVGRGHGG